MKILFLLHHLNWGKARAQVGGKHEVFWELFSHYEFYSFVGSLFDENFSFPIYNKFLIFLSHAFHLNFTSKCATEKARQNCNWNDDDETLLTKAFCMKIIWWKSTVFSLHPLNFGWSIKELSKVLKNSCNMCYNVYENFKSSKFMKKLKAQNSRPRESIRGTSPCK